jgi:Flp pilus assembly protein TadB
MSSPLIAVLLGALAGAGVLVVWRAVTARPVDLAIGLARLSGEGRSVADAPAADRRRAAWPPRRLVELAGTGVVGDVGRDLDVLDRTAERHAIDKLTASIALAAVPLGFGVLLVVGGVGAPLGLIALGTFIGAAVGFVLPDLTVRSQAAARRHAVRHALSSYLDLVNVLLAGGAGVETALHAAADAGDGPVFQRLRAALTRSRSARTSPWSALSDLGDRWGVDDLTELAASIQLAGEHGARVRTSIAAKAAAMRAHQMARIEADAHAATERMGLPTVLLFIGFLVLLGYPALHLIVGGFGG